MLGSNDMKRRVFLNLKEGAFVNKTKDGEENRYGYFGGYLKNIKKVNKVFNDGDVEQWEITFADENDPDVVYCLTGVYGNYTFIAIFNSLANAENLSERVIKLEAWMPKDGKYTRVSVRYADTGEKIPWKYEASEVPSVEDVYVEQIKKTIKSAVKRDAFAEKLVNEVLAKIGKTQESVEHADYTGQTATRTDAMPQQPVAQQPMPQQPYQSNQPDDDLPF